MSVKIQTGLRIPVGRYERLSEIANRTGISLNAVILMLVDVGLSALTLGTEEEFHALLHSLQDTSE